MLHNAYINVERIVGISKEVKAEAIFKPMKGQPQCLVRPFSGGHMEMMLLVMYTFLI
jgi:hypothetical protein